MTTMTSVDVIVTGGVDTHQDLHVAAALDQLGRVLGTESFPTAVVGYRQLLAWLRRHGQLDKVGVECLSTTTSKCPLPALKLRLQPGVAKLQQPLHVRPKDQAVNQAAKRASGRGVTDDIGHEGGAALHDERVLVPPLAEGTARLLVHEAVRSVVRRDG